jgi:cytochrome c
MIRTSKAFILCGAALGLAALPACHGAHGNGSAESNQAPTVGNMEQNTESVLVPPLPSTPAANDTRTLDGTNLADFAGDPEAGARFYSRCITCHGDIANPDGGAIGPNLAGVVGQPAARLTRFTHYSANLRASHIVWTPEKLFQYLENPLRVVPGTRMTFIGLLDPQDRADVIAWLRTQ